MIPKIIHYVWLSHDSLPVSIQDCIRSWKRAMPDYKIVRWSTENLDVASAPQYVQEAIRARKWAFASDYFRLYVLYHYGGIYLDSDVYALGSLDFALKNRFFSAIESEDDKIELIQKNGLIDKQGNPTHPDSYIWGIQIQAAIMGSEPGHPFVRDCLHWYEVNHFSYNKKDWGANIISPVIYAKVAEKYGFKYLNREQTLSEGIMIYSRDVFSPCSSLLTKESVVIHMCIGSWHKDTAKFSIWKWLVESGGRILFALHLRKGPITRQVHWRKERLRNEY
jgi:mannosyltransferase OCH1-like enzyme